MTDYTIKTLVDTKEKIIQKVERKQLSVNEASELLGMSRQGLWKLRNNYERYGRKALTGLKRGPKPGVKVWNKTPESIEERVEELFDEHVVGPVRLSWILEDEGIDLSPSTIYRILLRRGVIEKDPDRKIKKTYYKTGYPGEEVQIDTTEPFGKGGPILIDAVDDHTRWAFSKLYFGNDSDNSSTFLKEAVNKAPFEIERVRVDRGSEFKGKFITTCRKLGIEIIRNPKRNPTKNGKVERFHRSVEEECLWRIHAHKHSLEYTNCWLSRFIAWYNTKRRHQGHGMDGKTPKQKLEYWIRISIYQKVCHVNKTLTQYIF